MRPGTHRRDAEEYAASSRYIIEFLLMILLLELERRDLLVFACICDEAALLFICRMDDNSRFKLEIRIVAPNCRGRWYNLEKIVDADFTNFRDLVDEVVDKCPPSFGDVVKLFYSCMDTKANIQVCSDQDLVEMFAKYEASKCCYMTFCYHSLGSKPPEIPVWDVTTTSKSVAAPCTPSMPCPSITEPSFGTYTHETEQMPNPNPRDEYLGVDGEGLYIDIGPENPEPVNPQSQQRNPEPSQSDTCNDSDSDDESSSDDEIIKDSEPPQKPEASYNKMDPPMAVGTLYSDMAAFKLALAIHATKYEFHYNIEVSDKS